MAHVRFSYNGEVLYATKEERDLSIWNSRELDNGRSDPCITIDTDYITSTVSNGEVVFCAGEGPYRYSAQEWKKIESSAPYVVTFCASVSGRLALAGYELPQVLTSGFTEACLGF